MSKLMVKVGDEWVAMEGLKGDTGPLPADESIPDTALVTDGAKTNTAYLMRNRLTKDAEGELISVEDSYAVPPVSFGVDGKSTQVVTTGKNWFDRDNAPNGYYDGSTGAFVASGIIKWASIPVEEGDVIYWANMTNNYPSGWSNGEFVQLAPSRPSSPITVPAGVDEVRVYATKSTVNSIVTKNNSDLTPEPYTGGKPSPSPEYPQEITSTNEVTLVTTNKNLASPTETAVTRVSNGVTFEWDGEKLNASGTLTKDNADSASIAITNAPVMFAGNTYRFSLQGTFDAGGSGTTFYFHTSKRGETSTTLRYIFGSANQRSWKYTPAEDMVLRSIVLRIGKSGSTVNISARIQLELGSTATDYEPYSGATVQLLPEGTSLRSLPSGVKDELHLTYLRPSDRPGWAWYAGKLTKKVEELDLGTLTWRVATQTDGYVRAVSFVSKIPYTWFSKTAYMCSAYETASARGSAALLDVNTICTYATSHAIFVKDARWTSETTAEQVKEDLTGVMFYYAPSTPTIIQLDPIELPAMQSGTTNLWSDPSTNLSVTYERDRNIVITNLKAAVADLATS